MSYQRVSTNGFKAAVSAGKSDGLVVLKEGSYGPPRFEKAAGTREHERRLTWTISDGSRDRHGDRIEQTGWKLGNFRRGGSILWNHIHELPPVAKPIDVWLENGALKSTAQFPSKSLNPFAHMIYQMARRGYIRSSSVGFMPLTYEADSVEDESDSWFMPLHFIEQELLEWSPVSVPANPNALQDAAAKGIDLSPLRTFASRQLDGETPLGPWLTRDSAELIWRLTPADPPPSRGKNTEGCPDHDDDDDAAGETREKGVISWDTAHPNGTPLADIDEEWDGTAQVAAADIDDLTVMCAWFDGESDDDTKTAYKLPHHMADEDHTLVWRGVAAAMGALLGARGGVDIPDDEQAAVHAHLAQHYREFEKEPPELSADIDELDGDERGDDDDDGDAGDAGEPALIPEPASDEPALASRLLTTEDALRRYEQMQNDLRESVAAGASELLAHLAACRRLAVEMHDSQTVELAALCEAISGLTESCDDDAHAAPLSEAIDDTTNQEAISADDWKTLCATISSAVRSGIAKAAGRV